MTVAAIFDLQFSIEGMLLLVIGHSPLVIHRLQMVERGD
jgi:hypothetical protein